MLKLILGIFILFIVAFLLSESKRKFPFKIVVYGLIIQISFFVFFKKLTIGQDIFEICAAIFNKINSFSNVAASVLFGTNYADHFFAFSVLTNIVFLSAIVSILFYLGIIQKIIKLFALAMNFTFKFSGVEALVSSLNIFVGQTEAPLFVKPYMEKILRTELMVIMTVGMATISCGLISAYASMGINSGHLILANITSIFSAAIFAKIIVPGESSPIFENNKYLISVNYENFVDAAWHGGIQGGKLAVNIAIMLIVFVGLTSMINWILSFLLIFDFSVSLELVSGMIYRPFMFFFDTTPSEAIIISELCGKSTIFNEFISYLDLSESSAVMSEKSFSIATYLLCNFANIGSIAIQVGAFSILAPNLKNQIISLSLKALIAARLASFLTAYLFCLVDYL